MGSRKDRLNNETVRRREAKGYQEMLQKNSALLKQEVLSLLTGFYQNRNAMAADLRKGLMQEIKSIKKAERERLVEAGEEARRRAWLVIENKDSIRDLLHGYTLKREEISMGVQRELGRYKTSLAEGNKNRIWENKQLMNDQRVYLKALLE
ncbi:MAG: hypothetical protein ACOY46_15775 [Bacillota bacterium]